VRGNNGVPSREDGGCASEATVERVLPAVRVLYDEFRQTGWGCRPKGVDALIIITRNEDPGTFADHAIGIVDLPRKSGHLKKPAEG
jgi:hypothetical protein